LGFLPSGQPTITEHMAGNKGLYIEALRDADNACKDRLTDVSRMESLLDEMLKRQLASTPSPPSC
jgi:hypothetical protein